MPAPKNELRDEAIRLRKEERLSYKAIKDRLGVSKGSLSGWLGDMPLTAEERLESRRRSLVLVERPEAPKSKYADMVQGVQLSSDRKMRIAESASLFRMSLFGLRAFRSTSDNDRSDFIVLSTSGKWSVQVKWCQVGPYGLPYIPLRRSCGERRSKLRYEQGDFDFIVGYHLDFDACYVFSEAEVREHTSSITVDASALEAWKKMEENEKKPPHVRVRSAADHRKNGTDTQTGTR
jgi:transcriptional regulator with XRE-family HTH domain